MNDISHTHLVAPFLFLIVATIFLDGFGYNFFIADQIYQSQGETWALKESWILETVIHQGGRWLTGIMLLCVLTLFISSWHWRKTKAFRGPAGVLLSSVILSLIAVSFFKSLTHIDCPWSFKRYGGELLSVSISDALFGDGKGKCFPAGHASGGYAWIALYFFFSEINASYRFIGLTIGLTLGILFGFAQQLRGAHFLLDDIWTLGICWYVSLSIHTIFFKPGAKSTGITVKTSQQTDLKTFCPDKKRHQI